MAANDNSNALVNDVVGDFIHSRIWGAPIHTFIDRYCAAFDYDENDDGQNDEEKNETKSSLEEQRQIHSQYGKLVHSLIQSLGNDLSLEMEDLKKACEIQQDENNAIIIDESYEQLYSAKDFHLFQEMMRRRNLILQLQALVSLQLQWGLLRHTDTADDVVLALLLRATDSSSPRRDSISTSTSQSIELDHPIERQQHQENIKQKEKEKEKENDDDDDDDDVVIIKEPPNKAKKDRVRVEQPVKETYRLPGLRRKEEQDIDWHRNLRTDQSNESSSESERGSNVPSNINNVPENLLRDKLRELTIRTSSSVDDEKAALIKERNEFLKKQRDLIVHKQGEERKQNFEEEAKSARPQSAAHIARNAINHHQNTEQKTNISNEELAKRKAMMDRLKRDVVDKR